MTRWERLRRGYLPQNVRVLFVGESPPSGGTFFYAGDSNLYRATQAAFSAVYPFLSRRPFLPCFASMGCYMEDLCTEPVDHLSMKNPAERIERRAMWKAGERRLARRIRDLDPRVVVVVVMAITSSVDRAIQEAHSTATRYELPFPGQWWRARYVEKLEALARSFRTSRVLRPPTCDPSLFGARGTLTTASP